jgi:ribonuclease T2
LSRRDRSRPRYPAGPRLQRRAISLILAVVGALATAAYQYFAADDRPVAGAPAPAARQAGRAEFDFYLLALTVEPAFCEDGNSRLGQCRRLTRADFERTPLVLHGLWPERRRRGDYPTNCNGPALALESDTRAALARWMPGATEGLDRHEWRKHGTCTGLDDDSYYRESIVEVERANRVLGDALRAAAGARVSAAALRASAARVLPGFDRSVVFMCKNLRTDDARKRGRPYLYEVRVCLDDDGPGGAPGGLLECAAVGRRDEGCGAQFWVDDV